MCSSDLRGSNVSLTGELRVASLCLQCSRQSSYPYFTNKAHRGHDIHQDHTASQKQRLDLSSRPFEATPPAFSHDIVPQGLGEE